jgi:hypothetical protein
VNWQLNDHRISLFVANEVVSSCAMSTDFCLLQTVYYRALHLGTIFAATIELMF